MQSQNKLLVIRSIMKNNPFFYSILWTTARVLVTSAPMPVTLIVNHDDKRCADFWGGDECNYCTVPLGWTNLGYQAECPDGYEFLDGEEADRLDFYCLGSRGQACCSQGFSGYGDCTTLVVNEVAKQCAFSLCSTLPPNWVRANEKCDSPGGYTFVASNSLECEDPCGDLTTCGACIDLGCVWSNNECSSECAGSRSDCFYRSRGSPKTGVQACNDHFALELDKQTCTVHTSCSDCKAQTLPSNQSKRCKWINKCSDDVVGADCELCVDDTSPSCVFECRELDNCQDSKVCSADSCVSCLEEGCIWSGSSGCFKACSRDDFCVSPPISFHYFRWQSEPRMQRIRDRNRIAAKCTRYQELVDDNEACSGYFLPCDSTPEGCGTLSGCDRCLQLSWASDPSKTCTWFGDPGAADLSRSYSGACARDVSPLRFREVATCSADTSFNPPDCTLLNSCNGCLTEGCTWNGTMCSPFVCTSRGCL